MCLWKGVHPLEGLQSFLELTYHEHHRADRRADDGAGHDRYHN